MGRGRGGYVNKEVCYRDSGGYKVTDPGAIFIGERYIDLGYETVFRQEHPKTGKMYDLTIKSSNDKDFIKNIEVKRVTSSNPSKICDNIKKANKQFPTDNIDTIAIYLPNHVNNKIGRDFAKAGIDEAIRKNLIKGNIEIWFNDKTCIHINKKGEGF